MCDGFPFLSFAGHKKINLLSYQSVNFLFRSLFQIQFFLSSLEYDVFFSLVANSFGIGTAESYNLRSKTFEAEAASASSSVALILVILKVEIHFKASPNLRNFKWKKRKTKCIALYRTVETKS
jgi:hypothetical protein